MKRRRLLLAGGAACAALVLLGLIAIVVIELGPRAMGVAERDMPQAADRTARAWSIAISTLTSGPAAPPSATSVPTPTLQPSQTPVLSPTIAVIPSATLTVTIAVTPTTSARREWIAFESKRGKSGDYEIMVMATNGSRLTNLTNSWGDDVAPAWSPDGKWIAFVSLRDTVSGSLEYDTGDLYLLPFNPVTGKATGEVVRLTDSPAAEGWPAWSPDGERIAFHSDRAGSFDIWVMNADGSDPVNLTQHEADDKHPSWSPDGKRIAFSSNRTGDSDVWVMNADGSSPANLTRHPACDRYPIWSPNGRQLTFNTDRAATAGGTPGKQEVYMMNADGSGLKNISRTPRYDEGLADWSPDGRRVVLYSEQQHNKEIYVVDLRTGKWTNLTKNPASDEYCAWWP